MHRSFEGHFTVGQNKGCWANMFCFTGISVMQDVNVILMYQVIFKSPGTVKNLNYFLLQIYHHDNITNSYVCIQ